MITFLELNGIHLTYQQKELSKMILSVAAGEYDDKFMLKWLLDHEI